MISPPPLCGTDWMPYNRGLLDGARVARAASDGARINRNTFAISAGDIWKRAEAQFLGQRSMLTFTDSASASRFGLQMARSQSIG